MKNKEIFSARLAAFCGLIVLSVTLFNTEMKLWLMEHWMVVIFFFGLFLVSLSLISIWVRFILKGIINEYYLPLTTEIAALTKRYDNLAGKNQEAELLSGIKSSVARSILIRLIRFFI
jgi:sensor histidine kinase YesM